MDKEISAVKITNSLHSIRLYFLPKNCEKNSCKLIDNHHAKDQLEAKLSTNQGFGELQLSISQYLHFKVVCVKTFFSGKQNFPENVKFWLLLKVLRNKNKIEYNCLVLSCWGNILQRVYLHCPLDRKY